MLPHTGLFLLWKVALQMRIRRRLKNGHSGFAWLQSVFSDDLGNEWKSSVGFAREKL